MLCCSLSPSCLSLFDSSPIAKFKLLLHPASLLVLGCCTAATSSNSKLVPEGSVLSLSLLARSRGGDCAIAIHDMGGGRQLMRMIIPCKVDSSQSTAFWHNSMSKREGQSKTQRFCK